MKRGRPSKGDQLTGGSGDVSPQWFVFNTLTQTTANTFIEANVAIPVQRLFVRGKKSLVMELLKVQFSMSSWDSNPTAGGSIGQIQSQLSTASIGASNNASPQVLAYAAQNYKGAFTAAGSYETVVISPTVIDCTDGAGHGVLVATDNLFYGVNTAGYAGVASSTIRLLYRWKEVSLEEYIGIVQSQQ